MKVFYVFCFALLASLRTVYAQTDKNGNPVLHSEPTLVQEFDSFRLIGNYYTLRNNIDNKKSSVYIADTPAMDDVSIAALSIPSDYFILTKNGFIVAMMMLDMSTSPHFYTIALHSGRSESYPTLLSGHMTENRAIELNTKGFDKKSKIIKPNKLQFNNQVYSFVANEAILAEVMNLIRNKGMLEWPASEMYLPSKQEIEAYVLEQSAPGGDLDFFSPISKETNVAIEVKPGVFTTKSNLALYRWGSACFDLGVYTLEDVYKLYEKLKGSKLNQKELDYLKIGYRQELED